MSQRQRKRDRVKRAIESGLAPIKSGGKKIAKFAKSRIGGKYILLFKFLTYFVKLLRYHLTITLKRVT